MLPRSFQVAGLLEIRPAQSVGQLPLRPVTGSIQSELLFKVFLQTASLLLIFFVSLEPTAAICQHLGGSTTDLPE